MNRNRASEGLGFHLLVPIQREGDDHVLMHTVQEHSRLPDVVPSAVYEQQFPQKFELTDREVSIVGSLPTLQ
jgi:hypothetical protein